MAGFVDDADLGQAVVDVGRLLGGAKEAALAFRMVAVVPGPDIPAEVQQGQAKEEAEGPASQAGYEPAHRALRRSGFPTSGRTLGSDEVKIAE